MFRTGAGLPLTRVAAAFAAASWCLLAACRHTEDSLGYNDLPTRFGRGGASANGDYPNPFRDDLGRSPAEIATKLDDAYQQLFHGDPDTQSVYYELGTDEAYIYDVYHDDTRTDGVGYAMMVSVQLDHQDEFNRTWIWAKQHMLFDSGPYQGLLAWHCTIEGTDCSDSPDPLGLTYIATALLFAEGRWGDGRGILDYGTEARQLLHLMLHLEDANDDPDGVATNVFDTGANLVRFAPSPDWTGVTCPGHMMPAYYEVWAEVMDEDRQQWLEISRATREFLDSVADSHTGLFPSRAGYGDVTEVENHFFGSDAYRVALNVALDAVWYGTAPWQVERCNALLEFFADAGLDTYVAMYELDGTPDVDYRSNALRASNGAGALVSTISEREAFLTDAWNLEIPSGEFRYYDGMLYLLSLLTLSGEYRIYLP